MTNGTNPERQRKIKTHVRGLLDSARADLSSAIIRLRDTRQTAQTVELVAQIRTHRNALLKLVAAIDKQLEVEEASG